MQNVLILGTLGDLVKKLVELELLDKEPTKENVIQMAAYYQILEHWPVTDKALVSQIIQSFRIQCAKHKELEVKLRDSDKALVHKLGSEEWILAAKTTTMTLHKYLDSKNNLNQAIVLLNSLGKYLGKPPITMLIEDSSVDGKE